MIFNWSVKKIYHATNVAYVTIFYRLPLNREARDLKSRTDANACILVIILDEMFSQYVSISNMHRSYLFSSVIGRLGCVAKFRGEIDADLVATHLGKNTHFEKK